MAKQLCFIDYMEPPSSVNNDQNMIAGPSADDPLSCIFTKKSYALIVCVPDEYQGCGFSYLCDLGSCSWSRVSYSELEIADAEILI